MNNEKPGLFSSLFIFIITVVLLAVILEVFLVFKNLDGKNYDIEMWKYSRSLKKISANPKLGHEHIPNKSAKLQNIDIKINSLGMRGAEPSSGAALKILALGSSITFGWGVEEAEIYPELIEKDLNQYIVSNPGSSFAQKYKSVDIMNAGIGNYNSVREIELLTTNYKDIKPQIILLGSFIRDPEIISVPKSNWLLENSQLAVTLWSRFEQIKRALGVKESFEDHYKNIYQDDYPGWIATQEAYERLADYSKANNIRVIVTMIPDIHNLNDYPFGYIHEKIKSLALANGFEFIDLLPAFSTIKKAEDVWAMPGDPHPNALGHELIAKEIVEYIMK